MLRETHARDTPCREAPSNYSSLLLYGSSAIQTSVTLLRLRHRILDAAECQHGMAAIRTDAYDTLADSVCE